MKKVFIIINEQHNLLPDQVRAFHQVFGEDIEIERVNIPAQGMTKQEMDELFKRFERGEIVVFASPIPYLLGKFAFYCGYGQAGREFRTPVVGLHLFVYVLHNDRRDKIEKDGKILSVISKEGWEVLPVGHMSW